MQLFDVDEEAENLDDITNSIELKDENVYIADTQKAIHLISQLLYGERINSRTKLIKISEYFKNIFQLINDCDIPNMFEQQRELEMYLDRLIEFGSADILRGKHVVSLVGRFSAGKSKFINAITGIENILPVDQNPTTSVPSYIVHFDIDRIEVNTKFGCSVNLDKEAMNALTHEFYNKYKIGFSSILENIIIKSSKYNIDDRIVLLDTPGYSKMDVDNNVRERTSDRQKAHDKLSITDYLIWLVDITKGTITNEDLEFIRSLHLTNKILFVFTKADKKTSSEIKMVVDQAKETILNAGIDCFGVTAFSSEKKEEYFDNSIKKYLEEVVNNPKSENDIIQQIDNITTNIIEIINNEKQLIIRRKKEYFNMLKDTNNVTAVQSIAKLWKNESIRLEKISDIIKNFRKLVERLHNIISEEYK